MAAALPPVPKTAVVLGASIGGMMSAAAVALAFDHVIILDRDVKPDDDSPLDGKGRRGVPQDTQTHVFMSAGRVVAEKFMPGFLDKLVENGAFPVDRTNRFKYYYNRWLKKYSDGSFMYSCVRSLIDHTMRQMLVKTFGDKIEFRWETPAAGIEMSPDKKRVIGVKLEDDSIITADLVLDCMGTASPMEKWMTKHGFEEPKKWSYEIRLGYSTLVWELPKVEAGQKDKFDCDGLYIFHLPERKLNRGVLAFRILPRGIAGIPADAPLEPRYITATVYGFHEDQPKCATPEEWMAFCRTVASPACVEYLEGAKPIGMPKPFTKPKQSWRRYDLAKKWPDGLVSVGDAFCAMDPTLGQGMSLSCLSAAVLRKHAVKLASKRRGACHATQKAIASEAVYSTFMLNAVIDYRMDPVKPTFENFLPPMTWLLHPFFRATFRASARSVLVFSKFISVSHLERGPSALMRPDVLFMLLIFGMC